MMIKRYILFCMVGVSLLSQVCLALPSFLKRKKKREDDWKRYYALVNHEEPVGLGFFSSDDTDEMVQDSWKKEDELYDDNEELPQDLEKESALISIAAFEKTVEYEMQELANEIFKKKFEVRCSYTRSDSCVTIQLLHNHKIFMYKKKKKKFIEKIESNIPTKDIQSVRIQFCRKLYPKQSNNFFLKEYEVLIPRIDNDDR